jgi:hypothetical protein
MPFVDEVGGDALEALRRRDWETLRRLVHPYVRWSSPDGSTARGRTKLLAVLAETRAIAAIEVDELRDGQIYRLRLGVQESGPS